jgi:heme/copper-type cytochrome/quinol oxidase subunit 3
VTISVFVPEPEPLELVARNIAVGMRLWAAATAFVFLCPFFAYLYLRSLNTADLWHPAHVDPPQVLGAAIVVLTVASAVVLVLAAPRSQPSGPSLLLEAISLALGLGAVALQIVAYFRLGFGPTDGGYASVFVAWTGLSALYALGTMLWLETFLASSWRRVADAARGPRLAAFAFYWAFLAGLSVVMWFCLYVVA